MEYLVTLPFTWGGTDYVAGNRVSEEIEDTPNFRSLCDGYLLPLREDVVEHCYLVIRRFRGDGKEWTPGELVDLRDKTWRNEGNLVKTEYLQRATASEVRQALQTTPGNPSPSSFLGARFLTDEAWLKEQYVELEHSGTQVAKDAGCSATHVYAALRSFGIPVRKRGFQKKEVK